MGENKHGLEANTVSVYMALKHLEMRVFTGFMQAMS